MSKQLIKYIWMIGGVVSIVIVALVFLNLPKQSENSPSSAAFSSSNVLNIELPDLTLENLAGEPLALRDLKGQAVLINFWATWCPPCQREMPTLEAFQQAHQAEEMLVVAINAGELAALVAPYIEEQQLTFEILLDPDMRASAAFQVASVPTTFFVDKAGVIRERYAGPLSLEQVEAKMAALP